MESYKELVVLLRGGIRPLQGQHAFVHRVGFEFTFLVFELAKRFGAVDGTATVIGVSTLQTQGLET
jgi:hypothetical protein